MNAVEERKVLYRFWHFKPQPSPDLLCTGLNSPCRLIQIKYFTLLIKYFSFYRQGDTVYFSN